nr:hypothetical protein CFP56_24228 [Quercus suber]
MIVDEAKDGERGLEEHACRIGAAGEVVETKPSFSYEGGGSSVPVPSVAQSPASRGRNVVRASPDCLDPAAADPGCWPASLQDCGFGRAPTAGAAGVSRHLAARAPVGCQGSRMSRWTARDDGAARRRASEPTIRAGAALGGVAAARHSWHDHVADMMSCCGCVG